MTTERRENHNECQDNKARKYTRRVNGGEVWFCHHCGESGFTPDGTSTPSRTSRDAEMVLQSWNRGTGSSEQMVRNIRLPRDSSSEIPIIGLGWLYKYYITDEEIKQFGICYSEQYHRLILPVYDIDGVLVYWQGRSLKQSYNKDNPKYLNIRQSGAKNVFFKVINPVNFVDQTDTEYPLYHPDCLIIVEDILSAIRVGRTHNSLALLGSYFPTTLLNEFRDYTTILIYLDHDKWSTAIKASIKFNKLTGKRFIVKQHILDPKELTPVELEIFLTEI